MEFKHTSYVVGQSAYHLVWRPKYNVKVSFKDFPKKICENAIKEVAKKWKIEIIELKIMPDHIYCFVEIPATISMSFVL